MLLQAIAATVPSCRSATLCFHNHCINGYNGFTT